MRNFANVAYPVFDYQLLVMSAILTASFKGRIFLWEIKAGALNHKK